MRLHRPHRTAALAVVALVALVACGGGGKKQAASSPSSSPTTTALVTTTAPPPVSPLTGLPATDPAALARPALVVKIDNANGEGSSGARPQIGINQADIVYEEMVEGSVTRLAAIFHSTGSDPVGPVRSARTTDVAVFSPLNRPLFAWSGANADFASIIRNSPLIDVGYDAASDAYFRSGRAGHVAPHNLYANTSALWDAGGAGQPPAPLFQYLAAGEAPPASAAPTASIQLRFGGGSGSAPVDYTWDAGANGWARNQGGTPDVDEAGVQVAPQNVVVLLVGYRDTGYVDPSGAPVPEADLVGSGECWILTQGKLVKGTWTKTAPEAVTTYTDATGAPIKLTPGRTWVELVPPGGASVTG